MNRPSDHPLLQEINSLLAKQGKSFESAVREYRSSIIMDIVADEEKDENCWVEKFKKYRSRISENSKLKSYQELQKLRDYLLGQNIIKPAPLLHLVDDPAMDRIIKKISIEIHEQVKDL